MKKTLYLERTYKISGFKQTMDNRRSCVSGPSNNENCGFSSHLKSEARFLFCGIFLMENKAAITGTLPLYQPLPI